MKHPVSREFFSYWDGKRGEARAPDRSDIDPFALRERLGDIFVLSYDNAGSYPFRVAGTRVCALFGRDVKDESFPALFARQHRRDIAEIISAVAEDMLPAVAGITATSSLGIAGLVSAILSRTVALNRTLSCMTTPICRRSHELSTWARSTPSTKTRPLSGT